MAENKMNDIKEEMIHEGTFIVKSMRWGYDGGGFACGPVEGNTNVEIMVYDEDGKSAFILLSRTMEFEKVMIGKFPMFDIALNMMNSECDFEEEWGKLREMADEEYDYEIYERPDDWESKYGPAIHLARLAMRECYEMSNPDYESAQKFIEKYIDEDICMMELPSLDATSEEWDQDNEYKDDFIHAYDLKTMIIEDEEEIQAECKVDHKLGIKTIYCTGYYCDDEFYFGIEEGSVIGRPMQKIEFEGLEETRKSQFHEVFRRLMGTLEKMKSQI